MDWRLMAIKKRRPHPMPSAAPKMDGMAAIADAAACYLVP
jgi:hypothetical protein